MYWPATAFIWGVSGCPPRRRTARGQIGDGIMTIYRVFIKYFVFFQIFYNIPESGLSLFSLGVSVCTLQAGRTPALQQHWQSSEKSQIFKEKAQYLMNTLY